jgi:signal transduction histidine kinase/CheY-like chemotaxis protein
MKQIDTERIRILLIEDNPGDARLLHETLSEGTGAPFELAWVERLSEGLERLTQDNVELVLLDLTLPDSRGYDTFATLQTRAPHTPIIVLSGLADEELAVRAVREGAQDYLVKGHIDSGLLIRAIWYAIERKQADEEIRRRAAHLEALNAVIAAAAAAPSLPELLNSAIENTLQALGLERGIIWQADQYAVRGIKDETELAQLRDVMLLGPRITKPIVVEDRQEMDVTTQPAGRSPEITSLPDRLVARAFLGVPIVIKDRQVGGLAVGSPSPRHWLAGEIALVEAVGQQLGAAVERLRLFQAEREQRELAEALQKAASALSGTLKTDEVLDRILEQVERVVPGDAFSVTLLTGDDDGQVTLWRGHEQFQETLDGQARQGEEAPAPPRLIEMAQTREPIVIPDTTTSPGWPGHESLGWVRSYVGAPIRIGDDTVGFLNVSSARTNQFRPADASRLQAFTDHAAAAIRNARLYRREVDHAEQLEQRVQERTSQLQTQFAQLEAVLRRSSDGIIVTDREGAILQANPVALTWLTRTLSPDDAGLLRRAVHDLTRHAEERPHTVLELVGLDLELRVAPITAPGAEEAAAVVAVHDVSHLKALDRMKSRFVSNVSHELRTPITTIKLYAALMQRPVKDRWEENLGMLVQETDRLARLVEDILQVSRIDSGRLALRPRPVSLNDLVDTVVVNYQVLAEEQGLELCHDLVEPSPVALVDPNQMVQVLVNLVTNAIQYTQRGGKATITTNRERAEGRTWATVSVRDTGMGIPEEEMPHIFDRFFRGEQPRAMQVPGTGLGLAIAREIVELQGGQILVESQVNVGSTFAVWLPLAS